MDHRRPELSPTSQAGGKLHLFGAFPRSFLAVLGAALAVGAPLVLSSAPPAAFERTFASPRELGEEVLEGLHDRDHERLAALALSEEEFKDDVWPEMPAEGSVPAEYVWSDLRAKSARSLSRSIVRYGGRRYALVDLRFKEGTTAYGTFVVHRRMQLLVRDENGLEGAVEALGSVIEKNGRYKLFSFVVD